MSRQVFYRQGDAASAKPGAGSVSVSVDRKRIREC